jgi:hypothetical protein
MSLRRNIGNVMPLASTNADKVLFATTMAVPLPTLKPAAPIAIVQYPPAQASSNATSVNQIVPGVPNTFLYAGLGAGALWLATRKGKKISGTGKKKQSLVPLLLVGGGVLAYYLYTTYNTVSVLPGNNDSATTPAGTANGSAIAPINAVTNPAIALPNDTTIYNLLTSYSIPWRYAVDRMSAAERQALYSYVWGYIKKGLRLYDYPGVYQDGYYDAVLYTQIKALTDKWNLGLLN